MSGDLSGEVREKKQAALLARNEPETVGDDETMREIQASPLAGEATPDGGRASRRGRPRQAPSLPVCAAPPTR